MTLRLTAIRLGALAVLLAAPAAHAFTVVDPNGGAGAGAPHFDLEEQTRQFRSGSAGSAGAAIREFQTPFGKSTIQFGTQGPFGSSFGSSGFRAQDDRRHMDRMLSAPGLQHQYDR